jgi:para-nitrobenzyl esterase
MRRTVRSAVLLLVVAAVALAQAPAGTVVTTTRGVVEGTLAADVEIFRGIPYAAPPVGALRWRPPQPAERWTGTRAATTNGASCASNEDCLYLNVFRPAGARAGQRLPVMVWIHGGAFTAGSASSYDASTFARQGIVAVAINYRLGRAGWYVHPALLRESPNGAVGNYGLLDQIAALRWVRDNATAFGGDSANVTIFGESAGAISINFLMLAADARGLFHRAISESGFGRYTPTPLDAAARASAAAVPTVIGDGPEAAAALRALPLAELGARPGLGSLGPILDGKTITHTLPDGFARGLQAKVPFLLGGNSNEASLFQSMIGDGTARLGGYAGAERDAILAAFDDDRSGDARRIVSRIVTAQQITEPDRNLAREHARAGQPTFLYYFSYLPVAQRATSLGVAHAGEIPYVFATGRGDAEAQDIARRTNAYWAAFAKTGDPGEAGGVRWPAFTAGRESLLEIGVGGPAVRVDFQKARLDLVAPRR